MRSILVSVLLALTTNVAFADSFAPWNDRSISPSASGPAATVEATGFAPWRERQTVPTVNVRSDEMQVSGAVENFFRPWS